MLKELCHFDGNCEFRNKCACNGNQNLICNITYQVEGIFFVEKQAQPTCNAKIYFGDAHICLCPAKNSTL